MKIRYKISKEGMKKGYWKLIDTLDGNTIESGYKSKRAILDNAVERNVLIGVDVNEYKQNEFEL